MTILINIRRSLVGLKPTLIMVLVQALITMVNIAYKLASNDGMSLSVLIAYRLIFGAAFITPIAFFAERGERPKLTGKIVLYGFLSGLLGGALGQNLYLKSLVLVSATFASAMSNLIPAITFVLAVIFRLEKLGWNTGSGRAKVLGTLLGIGGAMLFTFYKGPELHIGDTGINLLKSSSSNPSLSHIPAASGHKLVLGLLSGITGCLCYSLYLIIQAKAAETYPCPYSLTAMMNFWGAIQSVADALATEGDHRAQWALGWNVRLLAVFIVGVLGSGLMFTLVVWCVRVRDPLFGSVFNPLMLVMVAVAGTLFLEEKLHLGMVYGSVFIVLGLYMVLWGKGRELEKARRIIPDDDDIQANTTKDGSFISKEIEQEDKDESVYMYP